MAQISRKADKKQSDTESSLGSLGVVRAILEHDELRIRQALRRSGEKGLLEPVLEDFKRARIEIERVQQVLVEAWQSGQKSGWN